MSLDVWLTVDEPVVVVSDEVITTEVFSANITHNLNTMAELAGLYEHLWHPEVTTNASELIKPLAEGLIELISDPDKYRKLNPANGWGKYEDLVNFVTKYLGACVRYPDSKVNVSR